MDAVMGVLGQIGNVFQIVLGVLSVGLDVLLNFSAVLFVGGFIGVLLTFLWFFFKYLDKKSLVLPAIAFTLFFIIFLGGNVLLIAQDVKNSRQNTGQETTQAVPANQPDAADNTGPEELPEPAMKGRVNL